MTGTLPHEELVRRLLEWFKANARDLPWRATNDPYAIWVSEIMLQQTRVGTVIPYWTRWMEQFPTIASLAGAEEREALKCWEGLGYYSRARNLRAGAGALVAEGWDNVPDNWDRILDLPGVGPYTAGAIASIAFDQPRPILDGNVIRVLARVAPEESSVALSATRKRLWAMAEDLVVVADRLRAELDGIRPCSTLNQALMELGATLCTPRAPNCAQCPIQGLCNGRRLGLEASLPILAARPPLRPKRTVGLVVSHKAQFLVRQRPDGGVNNGLWEFPTFELPASQEVSLWVARALGPAGRPALWFTHKHSITRHRIELQVWRIDCPSKTTFALLAKKFEAVAVDRSQIQRLPFPAAQARVVRKLGELTARPAKIGR